MWPCSPTPCNGTPRPSRSRTSVSSACRRAGMGANKFGVIFEPLGLDHPPQYAVRHQNPDLAFDLQDTCVACLIGRTKVVADGAQIRWIDENLRNRRIAMRHENHEQHGNEQRCGDRRQNCCLAPPEDRQNSLVVDPIARRYADGDVGGADGGRSGWARGFEHAFSTLLTGAARHARVVAPGGPGRAGPHTQLKAMPPDVFRQVRMVNQFIRGQELMGGVRLYFHHPPHRGLTSGYGAKAEKPSRPRAEAPGSVSRAVSRPRRRA